MIASKLFILGLTGASNASTLSKRQVSDATANSPDVCFPSNSTGFPDLNAPCNALSRIQQLCVFGEQIRSILDSPDLNDYSQIDSGDMKQHSPGYQRDCICSSQQFDQMRGCMACYDAHGGDAQAVVEPKAIESFSSSYCAAEATPTVGYPTAILAIVGGVGGIEETGSASDVSSASLFDSIGTQTDVSLYYTPSATGSQAWDVALPTGSSATFSNLSTSGGQIVPTAAVERVESTGDAETSTTTAVQQAESTGDVKNSTTGTVSEGGAMATGTIDRNMAFGAVGVAAIVAGLQAYEHAFLARLISI